MIIIYILQPLASISNKTVINDHSLIGRESYALLLKHSPCERKNCVQNDLYLIVQMLKDI